MPNLSVIYRYFQITNYQLPITVYMNTKIAQLILTPGARAGTTSEIFVAQPDADKEALVGKLFVLIEIESKKVNDLKILNFLIENLNNNYYQNEKIILRERVKTVKVEHIFESALAKTNKNLAEFFRSEKIKLNPKLINATIGVIYGNDLHFANIGKNKAFLIYKHAEELKKYGLADVIKQSEEPGTKASTNSNKLFSSVTSGHIPKNGCFVFTNEALPEYLSGRQMIEIITTLPPAGAAEQIKNSLSKINHYVSFLGIIIKNSSSAVETRQRLVSTDGGIKAEAPSTPESISNLNKIEERTEKLLAPKGLIDFKKWMGLLGRLNLGAILPKAPKKQSGAGALKDKIFFKKKTALPRAKKIVSILKNSVLYLVNSVIYALKFAADKKKLLEAGAKIKSIPSAFKEKMRDLSQWFGNLSKKNKILFVVALASILLLTQNLLSLSIKNNKIEEEQNYADLIKPIEQKQNQAAASLLYGNEDKAGKLLNEIRGLLAELPRETDEQIRQYGVFEKKLNEQLEEIRHVVKIENPEELAVFSNLNPNANPTNLILSPDNKIYAGDSDQKTIYSLDLSDNLITAIAGLNPEIKFIEYPVQSKSGNIYYFNHGSIVQFNAETEEISSLPIGLSGNPQDITAAAGYNNRLYLLNSRENQIYRFNKRASGFTEAVPWMKEAADFSNAVDMFIDGHIYVLRSDGQLLKYLRGQKQDFALDAVEPAIEQATKVFISGELKYIYILEPSKQRLIIFDKTGGFLMQYQTDQLTDLKDFAVDEQAKKIYLLNGSSVYEIKATHFE